MSNLGQSDDIQRTRELGAKDYLVKANFSINEVVAKIRNFLSQSGTKPSAVATASPEAPAPPDKINKKTIARCEHCNKPVPAGAKFCPYCGQELAAATAEDTGAEEKKVKVKKV